MVEVNDRVVRRLFRAVERSNDRYSLSEEAIRRAMADAVQLYMDTNFGRNQVNDVYWEGDRLVCRKVDGLYSRTPFDEREFDFGRLSEKRLREILRTFQLFLDYADAGETYRRVKGLVGDIVYGRVMRYSEGEAVISFYDNTGTELLGVCSDRHLLPEERRFSVLMSGQQDVMLFYVRSITVYSGVVRINLSRKSIKIPELLIRESLQRYGYNLSDYYFRCVRRIAGRKSLVVSIGFLPQDVYREVRSELGIENLRVFAFKKDSRDVKEFLSNRLALEDLVSRYINLSTMRDIEKLSKKQNKNKKDNKKAVGVR